MKKILTILICVVLGVVNAFAGGGSTTKYKLYANANAYVSNTGGGMVTASASNTPPEASSDQWKNPFTDKIEVRAEHDSTYEHGTLNNKKTVVWYSYPLFYHAKADPSYTAVGWVSDPTKSVDNNNKGSSKNLSGGWQISDNTGAYKDGTVDPAPAKWYAVFKPIVSLYDNDTYRSEESITVKKSIGSNIVPLCLYNAQGLSCTRSSGSENISCTILSANESNAPTVSFDNSTTYTGTYYIKVAITDDATADDVATFTFSSNNNGGTATLNVGVDEDVKEINVTFKSNGKLPYIATDGGSGAVYTITQGHEHADKSIKLAGENITLNVKKTDYRLYRFKIERGESVLYLYNHSAQTNDINKAYEAMDGDVVSIEAIGDSYARYRVDYVGLDKTESNYYDNLQHALNFATDASVTKKIVYVTKSGNVNTRKTLDPDADSDAYLIPSGVTLLIPADQEETCRTDGLTPEDFTEQITTSNVQAYCVLYRYLKLDSDTDFDVDGNICVYAHLNYGQQHLGMPMTYSMIKMGANSTITLRDKSRLLVAGFISGDNGSEIIAEPGAKVYETLQIRDWCGGSLGTSQYLGMKGHAFIIGQYYVQNIETTLKIKAGATEYLTSGVQITGGGKLVKTCPFVIPSTNDENAVGFVQLGDNAVFEKYYNRTDGRLYIKIFGDGSKGTAKIGNMVVEVFQDKGLDSKDYILPINMNMRITLDNVDVQNRYRLAMLAESTLTVNSNSSLTLNGDIIVYDSDYHPQVVPGDSKKENGNSWGFHRSPTVRCDQEAPIIVISPENLFEGKCIGQQMRVFRNGDAIIDVNGVLTTTSSGMLYTTGEAGVINQDGTKTEGSGGAKITSSLGGGEINFGQIPSSIQTVTKQNKFYGNYNSAGTETSESFTSFSIPLTSAKLHNGGAEFKSYTETAGYTEAFRYSKSKEEWTMEVQHAKTTVPSFEYKIPNQAMISKNVTVVFTAPADLEFRIEKTSGSDNFTSGTPSWNKEERTLTIPISYAQTNIDGEYSATFAVTVTNRPELTIEPFTIIAKEDYQPLFECAINGDLNIADFCNTKTKNSTLIITPGNNGDNVTSLRNNNSNLVWSYEIVDDDENNFDFTFGDATDLSKAVVTFKPQSAGTKTATLKITATSKFVAQGQEPLVTTVAVTLSGSAALCSQPIELHKITQLFVGEENVALIANIGNGSNISIGYDPEYIELSPASGEATSYTIKALKAGTTTITATQLEHNGYAGSEDKIEITIFDAVTWNWDILYYGATHTDPLIVDQSISEWSLTLEDNRPEIMDAFTANHPNYTMSLPETVIEGEQIVKFMFRYGDNEVPLFAQLSDLRLLTACVESEDRYNALNLEADNSTYSEGVVTFNSTSSQISSWTMQFNGMPSRVTFTPTGSNRWRITQGPTASSVTQNAGSNWTSHPSGQEVSILLNATTRFIKFEYGASSDANNNNVGTLEHICVHKFDIVTNTDIVYLPVADGEYKEVTIKHLTEDNLQILKDAENLSIQPNTQLTQYGYYETILTLSATQAGEYSITANEGDATITIQVIAFEYPKGLPIITNDWKANTENKNNYHFYVDESQSQYVHWWSDETNPYIVLEYTGNKDIAHSMTFVFEGAPSVIKFDYNNSGSRNVDTKEWIVEEYNPTTSKWQNAIGLRTITGTHFEQELQYTTRKVRLSHKSDFVEESQVSNLIIEGYPSIILNPTELLLSDQTTSKIFTITAINLQNIQLQVDNSAFMLQYQYEQNGNTLWSTATSSPIQLKAESNIYPDALGINKVGDIVVKVSWVGATSISEGKVLVSNLDESNAPLGTVKLLGAKEIITSNNTLTGIWSGVPDGKTAGSPTTKQYYLNGTTSKPGYGFEPYAYQQIDVKNAFADGKALFDYLIIYGETTTTDDNSNILEPNNTRGSNARTPCYIYQKEGDNQYKYVQIIDNANSPTKWCPQNNDDALVVTEGGQLSVYITGFCPYATTGHTKDDEGVWYFRGPAGSRVDIYLENCHIYSRNKSKSGRKFGKTDDEAKFFAFTDDVVLGSGAVLVFENTIESINNPKEGSFDVAIHTIGHNVLKSNYGIYYNPLGDAGDVLAAQVSASVQVRLGHESHINIAQTIIDFDDKWPNKATRNNNGEYANTYRTNGFLSLQKQANHAPSIDLGNTKTIINFRGGRVELQNAEIVSPNYKTTLAISHRSGIMGNLKDFKFAYGIGTDDVGGTVKFYDGTTTVIPMEIEDVYRDFYLMDTEVVYENGVPKLDENGNVVTREISTTSCLRTPANTFIYGGSHCMLRACKYVTSRGGAPTDGAGNFLGLYKYPSASWNETKADGTVVPHKGGWTEIVGGNGRVTIPSGNLPNANYGTESITPNTNSTANDKSDDYLNFWVPEGYDDNVVIEVDKLIRTWLACMTEIQGGLLGVNARVGGDEYIGEDDEIHNLLYCQLDDYIYDVISASDGVTSSGDPNYTYKAPAKDPTEGASGKLYQEVPITYVSDYKQHNVISESDYEVTKKVYYVTTAKTDTWMNFTMPFDVEKIWMLEPYSEADIKTKFNEFKAEDEALANEGKLDKKSPNYLSPMERTKMWQAQHNADFAAFFGMAMAIGQHGKDFNDIYNDYYTWAKNHADAGKYTGDYDLRGLYELEHYNGSNFTTSHYFLYKNMGDWTLKEYDEVAVARWEVAPAVGADSILMNKGETYSMLFPYCTGCDVQYDSNGELVVDDFGLPVIVERDYWDYWSGKLLIFESTNGDPDPNTQDDNRPHTIKGSNYIAPSKVDSDTPWIFDGISPTSGIGVLTGNSTFSTMSVEDYEEVRDSIFTYDDTPYVETFLPAEIDELTGNPIYETLVPTESFLVANYHKPVKLITRSGRVVTEGSEDQGDDNSGTTTGGHMPTVGGGHSMFITGVDGGINVAVATPQQVRVISATGTILYSGYVNDNVDIPLPINGIYIVKGETEVQKIFY